MPQKVKCPICNKRILDIVSEATGEIETKCIHCSKVVKVKLNIKEKNK